MPIIPASLQALRPTRPQTLSEYQLSKQPQQQVQQGGLTSEQVSNIEAKQKELSNLSYEEYFSKYNSLPDYMKEYFTSPTELKQTSEYQSYEQQKQTYEAAQAEYSDYMAGYTRGASGGIVAGKVSASFMEGFKSGKLEEDFGRAESRYAAALKSSGVETYTVGGQTYFAKMPEGTSAPKINLLGKGTNPFEIGTYNPTTGVYTSPQGYKQSMASAPEGAMIIQQKYSVPKDTYTYDASSGLYSTVSPTGRQGTLYIRPPTVEERADIERRKEKETQFFSSLGTYQERGVLQLSGKSIWDFSDSGKEQIGKYVKEKIEKFGTEVSELYTPSLKERRLFEEQLVLEEQEINFLKQEIETQYPNPSSLNEQDYNVYVNRIENLNRRIEQYQQNYKNYETSIQQEQEKPLVTIGGIGLAGGFGEFGRGFVKGAIELPFTTASLITGLLTSPGEEIVKTGKGIVQLPGQIVQRPASTLGYIAGQAAAGKLYSMGVSSLVTSINKARTIEIKRNYKPTISQSVSVDKVIKISDNADGTANWKVSGNVKTKIMNPKTGKIIETLDTDYYSDVITATTKEGASKAIVETYSETLRRNGIRTYKETPKITIKKDVGTATGEFTFSASDNPSITLGRGESTITDFGTFRTRITGESIFTKTTEKIAKAQSTALSEIISKQLGKGRITKKITDDVSIEGEASLFYNRYRSDVSRELYPVKGYKKTVMDNVQNFENIRFDLKGTTVQPYLRRFKKAQIPERAYGEGFSIQFVPDEIAVKDFSPKESGGFGNVQDLLFKNQEQIAKSAVEAQAVAIAKTTAPKTISVVEKTTINQLPIGGIDKSVKGIISASLIESQYPTYVGGVSINKGTETGGNYFIGNVEQEQGSFFSLTGSAIRETPRVISPSSSVLDVRQDAKYRTISPIPSFGYQSPTLISKPAVKESQSFYSILSSKQIQEPKQVTRQNQIQIVPSVPITNIRTPTKPTPPRTNFGFGFDLFTEKEKPSKEQAYFGYVKKGKDWIKVTDKPATKQGAIDIAAQIVDTTLSARWKVEPVKKKIEGKERFVEVETSKLLQPTGYYETNKNKFRTFQQKKGVRTKLPNQGIELQRFRLDSPNETKKIQKARKESSVRNFFGM